ncbi:Outer membrane lipoprotein LolB [Sterolibacterium denitrificans]|uniref:Outer-membrane lipoprotein LolB n=1 Tax=Sterolibacterium denitrificans TaxID=157592 RepID=A0A7Z7HPK7_9PROT|nr:lipoprotein insertase outer membrane protein LolB [Sterolibacterium denitrificans]SMB21884.1 Outer membrane lipoprotein LolB [Sterolibacterium denitrificans]
MAQRLSAIARILACACCAAGLLSACATLTDFDAAPTIERPARADITAFSIEGRLAVRHAAQRHAVNVYWQHRPEADELLLSGPLGQGVARLSRTADGARLQLADQRQFDAADWETLAEQLLGVALPLSALPRWILAQPAAVPLQNGAFDAAGRLQWQQADGWRIDYLDYESPSAQALPTLLELRHGETEVRLKIDAWQLDAAAVTATAAGNAS